MIDGALLADNGRYIYVWPPDHSKPLRRNYDNIFRPRKAAANPKSETTSAHSNAPNSCKARTPTDVEAPMTSHELRESTTLWQSSRARLNVLSVFGVFGTGLAYSTYFQARSGDAPDSTVLSLLVASFVLYLFGTVGSIGLQLTFTEEKPLVFTYVHWLTLPLDFVTCVLMTGGTVMLTQAMAWTIVSGKAAFWFASAIMGVAPFATLWYPALILIVRNRGIVWPALCIAVGATPRKGSRLSQPEPVSLTKGEEPNHEARRFLDMYDQYGGALQYARKMLLPSLDWQNPIVRDPDTFQDLISSFCPDSKWVPSAGVIATILPCEKFLVGARRWFAAAEALHRMSAETARVHMTERVDRLLRLEKVLNNRLSEGITDDQGGGGRGGIHQPSKAGPTTTSGN